MSEFINTVDTVGDEALVLSIIDRTITEIADSITTSIGRYAFCKCSKLTSVDFPNVTSISEYAFAFCTAFTEFVYKNDTPIFIDDGAFWSSGIKRIDLWGKAKFIRDTIGTSSPFIFRGTPLTALIMRSTELCEIGLNASYLLNGSPIDSGTGYIYVPKDLVDSYKAASKWSTYAKRFRALEDYTVDGTITGELDSSKI